MEQIQNRDEADIAHRRLAWTGALTAAVYASLVAVYARGPLPYSRTVREVIAWSFVLTLLPLFYLGYKAVGVADTPRRTMLVIGFAALFCVLAVLIVPFHSTDFFGYINRGWQQAHYGLNPYVHRLGDVPGWQTDRMFTEHWVYNPNPYGFLFSQLAYLLCTLGGGNWWLTVGLFKGVNAIAYAATGWTVWAAATRLGQERPIIALYVFLWSPLILLHHIANGHNDILVGCFIALGMYAAVSERYLWIIPALTTATLLKYGPVILIPFALVFVLKKAGWRTTLLACIISAIMAAAASGPYLIDWDQLKLAEIRDNATLLDNSLHSFLFHIYKNLSRLVPALAPFQEAVSSGIGLLLRAAFLIFLAAVFYRFTRRATLDHFLFTCVLVLFVLVFVVVSKLNGWYVGLLLPAALFLDEKHWLRRVIVLISAAQVLSLTFFKQAYILNYFAMVLVPAWIIFRLVKNEQVGGSAS